MVRPFYPGGDYEAYDYSEKCVVIDNPPFSILSRIVRYYEDRGIDYFLFAPQLTCIGLPASSHICVGVTVTYENGAKVGTSFVASEGPLIRSAPELYSLLLQADNDVRGAVKGPARPKNTYPDNVLTSSSVALMSKYGVEYSEDRGLFVRALDAQRSAKKSIFGSGYVVPLPAARRAQEAVRRAQEASSACWELSARELAALSKLNTPLK